MTVQDLSDAELVRLCLLGKYQYYEGIVERYEVLVRTLVERLTDDIDASETVAHEAFVTAYDRLGEFSFSRGRFAIWLLDIAAEQARQHLRSKRGTRQLARFLPPSWRSRHGASAHLKKIERYVAPS